MIRNGLCDLIQIIFAHQKRMSHQQRQAGIARINRLNIQHPLETGQSPPTAMEVAKDFTDSRLPSALRVLDRSPWFSAAPLPDKGSGGGNPSFR